ncbi:MAG: shikimate kinase [Bacteroidetes bacterium HGW-Bacteroidetes-4]|jgi:shikimate kinase|nr:MAG: shikimate kinase [Bacteroidetes bacterium HGW-Bacteroidetes-4]
MRIYLLGYMGCGKSTIGKKLAKTLGIPFVDLDDQIEQQSGKTIVDIFEQDGEAIFRKIEQQALHLTFKLEDAVIATGGGTACYADNMDKMRANGVTVYIELPAKVLADRLKNAATKRPLLKDKSEAEQMAFIEEALLVREPYYRRACVIVNGIDLNVKTLLTSLTLP